MVILSEDLLHDDWVCVLVRVVARCQASSWAIGPIGTWSVDLLVVRGIGLVDNSQI